MKKLAFFAFFIGYMPFVLFAQKPLLNETFEKFSISTPDRFVETSSSVRWSANGASVSIVANPQKAGIDKSNLVLQISRNVNPEIVKGSQGKNHPGGNTYRGCSTDSYNFSMSEKLCIIELKVLKKVAGKLGIRITEANSFKEVISEELEGSDKWQLVRFDFTGKIPAIVDNTKLLFEMEKNPTAEAQTPELTVFIDDIKLIAK